MKNNFLLFIAAYSIVSACNPESKGAQFISETNFSVANTSKIRNKDTLRILCYGEKAPDLYANVQHFIQKKYSVKFIDVAGCEVTTKLIDSVKNCNAITYSHLNKHYNRNIEAEINNSIDGEYSYLTKLDNYLRKTQKKENSLILIYYVKKQNSYKAYYLFGAPTEKTLQYRIKSVLEIDSATKKTISSTKKDEILPYNLYELQNDNY